MYSKQLGFLSTRSTPSPAIRSVSQNSRAGQTERKIRYSSLPPIPTVGTEFAFIQPGCCDHIVQPLVFQRGKVHHLPDLFHHPCVFRGVRVAVQLQLAFVIRTFQHGDDPAGDQIHIRGGAGEVQVLAAEHDGRAGKADMYFLCAALVQEFRGFPELGAPYDGVVDQDQLLVPD